MLLGLKVLNHDATLNNFVEGSQARIVRGADAKIVLRLVQPDKGDLRYVPDSGAIFEVVFMNSDGTTLTKIPTQPFADDRSILQLELDDTETALLISQSLSVEVTEGTNTSFAILNLGFQVVTLNSDC